LDSIFGFYFWILFLDSIFGLSADRTRRLKPRFETLDMRHMCVFRSEIAHVLHISDRSAVYPGSRLTGFSN